MIVNTTEATALLEAIYGYVKEHGKTEAERFGGWVHTLVLPNGMTIMCKVEDEGYTHTLYVKGLVTAFHPDTKDVGYFVGNENGILTVYRILGLDK